jgi:membrane-associated protease RseP (regulator of RpoE activity)
MSATEITALLISWWFFTAIYVLGIGLVGNWAGLTVKYINIGIGQTLISFKFLGGLINFRLFPIAGSTTFQDDDIDDREDWDGIRFIDISLTHRILMILVGPLSNLFIGGVLLYLLHTRMGTLIGILGIWLGVVNLLPLPALSGGELLIALLPQTRHRNMTKLFPQWSLWLSLLTLLSFNAIFFWFFLERTDLLIALFTSR